MKIVKIASSTDQNKKDISSSNRDIKKLEKDVKDLKGDLKKIQQDIKGLNLGTRRFWQQQTVFTTLQRKLERFEKIEAEWKKYKENMDNKVKRLIERRTQSRP
jgi:archaellum component FlaC